MKTEWAISNAQTKSGVVYYKLWKDGVWRWSFGSVDDALDFQKWYDEEKKEG